MSRSSSPPSPNRYSVLPPVARNDINKAFLRELQQYLDTEMEQIEPTDKKQRYIIHSTAFNKLIDHVHAYKPLLTRVKKEYEDVIGAIERGKSEAGYLNDKIQSMAQEPTTLRNYRRRHDELARRIDVIRADNDRLKEELEVLKREKKAAEMAAHHTPQIEKRKPKKDSRNIPGLSLQECTDIPILQRELHKVENSIKELSAGKKSKFTERQHKDELKEKLTKKVSERDLLQQRNTWLIAKQKRLKVAHDAAISYINSKEPQYRTIADVIIMALAKSKTTSGEHRSFTSKDHHLGSSQLEDDDPTKEKEAEMILEYIEKFNELFEDGKYEEAAIHAANSPKGILRTMETMSRFKCVDANKDGRSPWLAFCDAIMSSVLALGVKPSDTMSVECVSCVLGENRLDLLSHWIAQDRLTVTEKLGDMIADHCKGRNRTYLDMAETIYRNCYAHRKVVNVMVRQGLYQRGLEYAKDKSFTTEDYLELLKSYPSYQLGFALSEMKDEAKTSAVIPAGMITRALIDANSHDVAMQILQKMFLRGPEETGTDNNGLKLAVYHDHMTSVNQWHEILKVAQDYGYEEVALELLAAITVQKVMKIAREASGLSEKSSSELNFSSAASSRARQDTGADTEQTE